MKARTPPAFRLAALLFVAIATGCSSPEPTVKTVGSAVSADGKRVLTLYSVVPGSTLEDYLALNLARPGGTYSPEDTLASFSEASKLRVFWTQTGRPTLIATRLEGVVFVRGKPTELLLCESVQNCPAPDAKRKPIAIERYPTD